jgi:hypothetical protein
MSTEQTAITPTPGVTTRQEFGAQQLTAQSETSASAVAAQSQATVQARYVVALQRPRDWDDVRTRIMREIERPGFADAAWFKKPIGAGVEGLSVRFTDMAARCMGNLLEESPVVYEDAFKRIVRVCVTDLEANLTKFKDVSIEKTVERNSLSGGRVALNVRTNTSGRPVYTLPATEDELLAKEGALISKVRRNLILQLVPGDIQDAARTRILAIRAGDAAKDPDAARRKVLDSFATLNVAPSDLKLYLGHDVSTCSPAELQDLRDVYAAIASGDVTWSELTTERRGAESTPPAAETKPKPGLEGIKDQLKTEQQLKLDAERKE